MSVSPGCLRGNRLADCSPSPPPHRSQSVQRIPVDRRPGLPDRAGNHALIAWGLSREPPCAFHGNQASALGLPGGEDRIDLADGVCGHAPAGLEPPHSNSAMGLRLCVSLGPARSAETLPRMPSAAHEPRPSRPTRRLVPGVDSWKPIEGGGRRLFSPYLKNGFVVQVAAASEFPDLASFGRAIVKLPLEFHLET